MAIANNELWVRSSDGSSVSINTNNFNQKLKGSKPLYGGWTVFTFDANLTKIGAKAFSGTTNSTKIIEVIIPKDVTSIGNDAFNGCTSLLTIISYAVSAPSLFSWSFYGISTVGSLHYPMGSDYSTWMSMLGTGWNGIEISVEEDEEDEEYFDPNIQISNNQIVMGHSQQFFSRASINTDRIAYAVINEKKQKDINGYYWTTIEFDSDVCYLDEHFFSGKGFEHLILPASLLYIGMEALDFMSCTAITCYAITAPMLGERVFDETENSGVLYIPDGSNYSSWLSLEYLGNYGWSYDVLGIDVEPYTPPIPKSVASNQIWVKYNNKYRVPRDVMYDSTGAKLELVSTSVNYSGWTIYEYSGDIHKIGSEAFMGYDVTHVMLPETLTVIGLNAFRNNMLTRLEIPNKVQTIEDGAFSHAFGFNGSNANGNLTWPFCHTIFGTGIKEIGSQAFYVNRGLRFITSLATIEPQITYDTFSAVSNLGILVYPDGSNYSSWLSTNSYYLGYYSWNSNTVDTYIMLTSDLGGEIEEEADHVFTVTHEYGRTITFDAPDEFIFNLIETTDNGDGTVTTTYTLWVDSDFSEESATVYISDGISTIEKIIYITSDIDMASPSINLNYNYLSFPASGGTTDSTFTAEYLNTVMAGVNPPRTTFDDVTIDDYGYTEKETSFKQWHKLTVGATTYERDIPLIFSCVGLDGSSCTEIITAYQSGQTNPIQLTPEYLSVPASGGYFTNAIKAVFSNASGGQQTTVKTFTRMPNGTYVPLDGHSQAWFKCYQNSYGGDTTRTEYYDLKVNENTNTEPFMGVVLFRYTNTYGSTYEREFYLVQDAGDGEVDVKDPEVQPYVTILKLDAEGNNAIQTNYTEIRVNYQDLKDGVVNTPVCNVDWFRITGTTLVDGYDSNDAGVIYHWVCDANTGDKARSTQVYFSATLDGNEYGQYTTVQQAYVEPEEPENPADPDNPPYNPDDPDEDRPDIPSIEGVYIGPIWKDVEFDFGSHEKVEYTVFYGPTLIFTGKAWKRPNDVSNKILVNKICQNYLTQGYLDLESLGWEINVNDFTLRSYDGSQVYHTYRFVNDWSYSNYFKAGSLYHPILENQIGVRGQMFPFSILGAGEQVSIQYGVEYFDGYTDKYGNPVEDWNSTEYITNGVSTDFFKVARRDADYIKTVWIGSNRFKLKESCEVPYVMYYLNPWGGFDWFPIQVKVTRKDRMTPYSYTKNYLNTNIGHGNSRYLSEIVPTFTLNTGWLKQIESDRMWYLLQSNVVYLHDLKLDRIYPVVITDQEVEYKQKTRTERILNYTFNVECAQTRERI